MLKSKEDKIHKVHLVMLICLECLVKEEKSWQVQNLKVVFHKSLQVLYYAIHCFLILNILIFVTESVRQAVTATGLTTAAPLETVAQAAGASAEIQAAYRSLLRTNVQASLRDNEDFTPERFPNAASYFNNTS